MPKFIIFASKKFWVRIFWMAQLPKDGCTNQASEEGQEDESLKLSWLKMSWQTRKSYPQRPLLKFELSASKCRHKRCSRRRFLLLKSLDSGNLLERPNRSMKALGHLRPWRQVPGKVLEGRRQNLSGHSLSKESSLSNGLLKGEGEPYL